MGVVVVGVDGSEPAAAAALAAARICAALGAELRVICAVSGGDDAGRDELGEWAFGPQPAAGADRAASGAAQAVDGVIARIRAFYPSLRITAHTSPDKPATALLQAADRFNAELIVVGNKNLQGAGRLLGSVANEVAKRAKCDVYIAHTNRRS